MGIPRRGGRHDMVNDPDELVNLWDDPAADRYCSPGRNWAGNYVYGARGLSRPRSLDELQQLVAGTERIRAIGSRHSFTDLADTDGQLVDIAGLPAEVTIDEQQRSATVAAGMNYGEVSRALESEGWALSNLASLPHISVAGAIATATHGSGRRNGNLASSVRSLEFVASDGSHRSVSRGDPDFNGSVVSLGALGIVTSVQLDIEPSFEVAQRVWERVPFDAVLEDLAAVFATAYSVSLFTNWRGDHVEQLWAKSRDDEPVPAADLLGGVPAKVDRHPVLAMPAQNCTPQLGRPGRWLDRLSHFRLEFTPSSGDELQSEYLVPFEQAVDAITALRRLGDEIAAVVQVGEIRAVGADELWLSSSYGTDAVAFHFTWHPDPASVARITHRIEAALEPFAARPHWGKVHSASAQRLQSLYPRYADFVDLAQRTDPAGTFRNDALGRWFPDLGRKTA